MVQNRDILKNYIKLAKIIKLIGTIVHKNIAKKAG